MYLVKTIKYGEECPSGIRKEKYSEALFMKITLENRGLDGYDYKIIEIED